MTQTMFHISVPVSSLDVARAFYIETLGCAPGRSGARRLDIDFFGHHLVAHLAPDEAAERSDEFHSDGVSVPLRHFGVIVPLERWHLLVERLQAAKVAFSMAPQCIREGTVEEQHIAMAPDGCGNVVELKSIAPERVFATAQ